MKILVCGSIGYGGIEKIKQMITFLESNNLEVLNQFTTHDYSNIRDFRGEDDLISEITTHDLTLVDECDIVVSVMNGPSFGTAIEMKKAKDLEKPVILFATVNVPSPWPIYLSTDIVRDKNELITKLHNI